MELKDFIRETLLNISQGVEEANETSQRFELSDQVHSGKGINGTSVEFEVGVIAEESTVKNKEGKANSGIKVGFANLFNAQATIAGGTSKQSDNTNQSTHRLKFQVFIKEK